MEQPRVLCETDPGLGPRQDMQLRHLRFAGESSVGHERPLDLTVEQVRSGWVVPDRKLNVHTPPSGAMQMQPIRGMRFKSQTLRHLGTLMP